MAITRTINLNVTIEIVCCKGVLTKFEPSPHTFYKTLTATKNSFDESLVVWRDRIVQKYEDYYWDQAEAECRGVGSRDLCEFNADWSRTTVDEKETIPKSILERVDKIKEYIEEAETYDEKKALQDEAIGLLKNYISEEEARKFVPV